MDTPTGQAIDDCVELLSALEQLSRARRRSIKRHQNASSVMMLAALHGCPDGLRISALAEVVMVDVSAASRLVTSLEATGLTDRVTDAADHRAQLVRLTDQGRSALADAVRVAGTDLAARVSNWAEVDIRTMTNLARRLASDLVASEPGCTRTPARTRHLTAVPG